MILLMKQEYLPSERKGLRPCVFDLNSYGIPGLLVIVAVLMLSHRPLYPSLSDEVRLLVILCGETL